MQIVQNLVQEVLSHPYLCMIAGFLAIVIPGLVKLASILHTL